MCLVPSFVLAIIVIPEWQEKKKLALKRARLTIIASEYPQKYARYRELMDLRSWTDAQSQEWKALRPEVMGMGGEFNELSRELDE